MHECYIDYEGLLKGEYKQRYYQLDTSYYEQRGARIRSNLFYDERHNFEGDTFRILVDVILIARRQAFEKINIMIPKKRIKYVGRLLADLMAYERTIVVTEEESDSYVMTIYIPENVWLEASIGITRGRRKQHALYMGEGELRAVREACELMPRSVEHNF